MQAIDRDKTLTESSLIISKISKVSRALALASPLQIPSPNPYRGAQGRNWRCALLLRLPGSFVPPRPWRSTIPGAADRVQCRPAKSCSLQKAATCSPATCAVHLPNAFKSLPVKAPPASVVGLLLLPLSLLHNPALGHLKSHQSLPLSRPLATPINYPIGPDNLTRHTRAHKTTERPTLHPAQLLLLTLFPLTAPQSSRSHPLNWTTTAPAEHNNNLS